MNRFNLLVDQLMALIEKGAISRWHLVLLLMLGVGLVTQGGDQSFELIGGNYANIISATISLLVLSEQKQAEKRNLERHEDLKSKVDTVVAPSDQSQDGK